MHSTSQHSSVTFTFPSAPNPKHPGSERRLQQHYRSVHHPFLLNKRSLVALLESGTKRGQQKPFISLQDWARAQQWNPNKYIQILNIQSQAGYVRAPESSMGNWSTTLRSTHRHHMALGDWKKLDVLWRSVYPVLDCVYHWWSFVNHLNHLNLVRLKMWTVTSNQLKSKTVANECSIVLCIQSS